MIYISLPANIIGKIFEVCNSLFYNLKAIYSCKGSYSIVHYGNRYDNVLSHFTQEMNVCYTLTWQENTGTYSNWHLKKILFFYPKSSKSMYTSIKLLSSSSLIHFSVCNHLNYETSRPATVYIHVFQKSEIRYLI